MTENQSSLPSSRDAKKPQPMFLTIKSLGGKKAEEGDSVGITFAKKRKRLGPGDQAESEDDNRDARP